MIPAGKQKLRATTDTLYAGDASGAKEHRDVYIELLHSEEQGLTAVMLRSRCFGKIQSLERVYILSRYSSPRFR